MRIGVPRETKDHEFRVGLTPAGAGALVAAGHEVRVETAAGERIGLPDEAYRDAGATVVPDAGAVYDADLVVKVKEPQPAELPLLREGQALFCYLHLAAAPAVARGLLDRNAERLKAFDDLYPGRLETRLANAVNIAECAARVDLVVGAIYVHRRRPERLLSRALVRGMQRGAALVDVSIDQGGIAETSRPTTHAAPFYVEEGVVHYCVTNMPAAVARTATVALTEATLPYVLALAGRGVAEALRADPGLAAGLNVAAGKVMHAGLAADLGEQAGGA